MTTAQLAYFENWTIREEYDMHCTLCGEKLELIERTPPPEFDYDADIDTIRHLEARWKAFQECKRDEYICPNGHFAQDYPLYCHQPFNGIDSAPGDSWSLSWVQ